MISWSNISGWSIKTQLIHWHTVCLWNHCDDATYYSQCYVTTKEQKKASPHPQVRRKPMWIRNPGREQSERERQSENSCLGPQRLASYYIAIVVGVYVSTDPSESRSISYSLWACHCQQGGGIGYAGTWLASLTHCQFLFLLFLPKHRHWCSIHKPLQGNSWPNKEGESQVGRRQDGQNEGEGTQKKRRVNDCRRGTMGGNDGWVKLWIRAWEWQCVRGRRSESECETLRGVMSGSVLGMHGLNWDTGPIHITVAKNTFPAQPTFSYSTHITSNVHTGKHTCKCL